MCRDGSQSRMNRKVTSRHNVPSNSIHLLKTTMDEKGGRSRHGGGWGGCGGGREYARECDWPLNLTVDRMGTYESTSKYLGPNHFILCEIRLHSPRLCEGTEPWFHPKQPQRPNTKICAVGFCDNHILLLQYNINYTKCWELFSYLRYQYFVRTS